jgi:hypothetical protein
MSDHSPLLSKDQAIEKMQEGKKVTHVSFTDDEFIVGVDGNMLDETGINFGPIRTTEFWDYRKGPEWETNWLIIE